MDLPYFKILDLPQPPQWLLDTIDRSSRPEYDKFNPDAEHGHMGIVGVEDWKDQSYKWIKPMHSNKNARHLFEPRATEWLLENISSNFNTNNSGWMFFDEEQLPHTDLTREWTILYNVDSGGNDVELSFWQEPGQPVHRTTGHQTWDSTDGLILLEAINGPFDCWYLMHTDCIHAVKKMSGVRLNLQLSYNRGVIPDALL